MLRLKTPAEIAQLAEGGKILATILDELEVATKVGVTPRELDHMARERIAASNCIPSFLNYAPRGHKPYPAALCVSVNDAIVHGLPTDKPIKAGDIVKLDLGLVYKNLYLDSARTVGIDPLAPDAIKLIAVTKEALAKGIAAAKVGATIGDIGAAVQQFVEGHGFGVVRQLVGHGVGYGVHEEPAVPNFGSPGTGLTLKPGLVVAIEPMVTMGSPAITTAPDGWTVVTSDGSLSAHAEHTVAVTEEGPRILTVVTRNP